MFNKKIDNLVKRNKKEQNFRRLGKLSIAFVLAFLVLIFSMIFFKGAKALISYKLILDVDLTAYSNQNNNQQIDHLMIIKNSLRQRFPEVQQASEINQLYQLLSQFSRFELKKQIADDQQLLNTKAKIILSLSSKSEMFFKYNNFSNLTEKQLQWLSDLRDDQQIVIKFNSNFFINADSREPEIAGIGASSLGSIMITIIFLILSFPIAIMCAFYLEEFAPKNRLTDIIEISINNLAAIPSIIYGLLGLVLYLQIADLPRSSSLVAGMTLAMLVLPVIIIATRNTIRSIPQNIRDGALGLGASKMQVILHHLLPLSMPGIMTGTILAISRAVGETAPLLMIGMVAFIADIPQNFFEPTTALPVQIYLWSDLQEQGFVEKTSLAIMILLAILILFNLGAIILRKKFEKKW